MSKMQNFGMNPIGIYEKAFPASLKWEERLNQAAKADYDFVILGTLTTGNKVIEREDTLALYALLSKHPFRPRL